MTYFCFCADVRYKLLDCIHCCFAFLMVPQHLHALGGKSGLKSAAKAKAEFAKVVLSRIEDLGALISDRWWR